MPQSALCETERNIGTPEKPSKFITAYNGNILTQWSLHHVFFWPNEDPGEGRCCHYGAINLYEATAVVWDNHFSVIYCICYSAPVLSEEGWAHIYSPLSSSHSAAAALLK